MDMKKFEKYKGYNFWFKNAKRILWTGSPLRLKSAEYRRKYPDITIRAISDFTAEDFDVLPASERNVTNLGESIKTIEKFLTDDYKNSFWLLNSGSDAYRALGKEFVGDLAIQNYIDMSKPRIRRIGKMPEREASLLRGAHLAIKKTNYKNQGVAIPDSDEDKDDLKEIEAKMSVGEYLRLLSAERIVSDPSLILTLVPENKIDPSKLSKMAVPVVEAHGKKYYDPIFIEEEKTKDDEKTVAPKIVDGSSVYVLGDNIKLATAQDEEKFNAFMARLGKNLKVRLVPNAGMNVGDVDMRQRSILRNAGRSILDRIKYRLNYRKNAISKSFEVEYSSRGSREEQMYSVLKGLGNLVCTRAFEDYEASFGKPEMIGMPNVEDYEKAHSAIKNAAAYLVAAQLACGFLPRSDDNKVLSELFKMEAMKELATLDKDNTWAVGVLGAVVSNALNNAFANGVVYEGIYESNTNSVWGKTKTFLSTLFSKKKKTFDGILTKQHFPTQKEIETKFAPEKKFDIHHLTKAQQDEMVLLIGRFVEKKYADTKEADLLKDKALTDEYSKIMEERILALDAGMPRKVKKAEKRLDEIELEHGRLYDKTVLYDDKGGIKDLCVDPYNDTIVHVKEKTVKEVIEMLKANPTLSTLELSKAVEQCLKDKELNDNTQTRVDNAITLVGRMEGMRAEKEGLDSLYTGDVEDIKKSLLPFDDEIEKEVRAKNPLLTRLNEFIAEAEGRDDVDKKLVEKAKQKSAELTKILENHKNKVGPKLLDKMLEGQKEAYAEVDARMNRLEENLKAQTYLATSLTVYSRHNLEDYDHFYDDKRMDVLRYYWNSKKSYDSCKEFIENLPVLEKYVDLKSINKDLVKLIKKDYVEILTLKEQELEKEVKESELAGEKILVQKVGEILILNYQKAIKDVDHQAFLAKEATSFAEEIVEELTKRGAKVKSVEEAYDLYKSYVEKEHIKGPEQCIDTFEEIEYVMATVDIANYFKVTNIPKYKAVIEEEIKNNESYPEKLAKLQAIKDEAIKKGLTEENEAFAAFDAAYAKLQNQAIRTQVAIAEHKVAVNHLEKCVEVVNNLMPVEEGEKPVTAKKEKYKEAIKLVCGIGEIDEEYQKERSQAFADIWDSSEIEAVAPLDFDEIDGLAKTLQEQKPVNKFERKERDWKAIAKMVNSVKKKGLSFEETIKAIENYKSGKTQTERDKANIKEFLTVYGYVAKLGDEVFAKEDNKISKLSAEERSKLDASCVKDFYILQEWLHVEHIYGGIKTLSDKLQEYKDRPSQQSRSATEINEMYFDLATKIVESAAKDIKNSALQSGLEVGRTYIKKAEVNGYKDGMIGSVVMKKKLSKYMPKKDLEKIRAEKEKREAERKAKARALKKLYKNGKPKFVPLYEEELLKEVLKCLNDYTYLDLDTYAKMKLDLFKVSITEAVLPAKVGEADVISKAIIAKKLSPQDLAYIERITSKIAQEIDLNVQDKSNMEKLVTDTYSHLDKLVHSSITYTGREKITDRKADDARKKGGFGTHKSSKDFKSMRARAQLIGMLSDPKSLSGESDKRDLDSDVVL